MLFDKSSSPEAKALRAAVLAKTREYFAAAYGQRTFVPGEDAAPVSGRVFDKSSSPEAKALRAAVLAKTREYFAAAYGQRTFVPGEDAAPVSGRVFDERDMVSLVDSALDFWLTTGRFAERFEREFARWYGVRECVLVNSGSSANL